MRNTITAAVLIVTAGLTLTACGGSSPKPTAPAKPKVSAAVACGDFSSWYLSVGGNVATVKNLSKLQAAVSAAPSGQLYQDLSTLESDVMTTASQGGSLGQAEALMTKTAALAVAQDCQSINPNS